jgi:hypothetical protein
MTALIKARFFMLSMGLIGVATAYANYLLSFHEIESVLIAYTGPGLVLGISLLIFFSFFRRVFTGPVYKKIFFLVLCTGSYTAALNVFMLFIQNRHIAEFFEALNSFFYGAFDFAGTGFLGLIPGIIGALIFMAAMWLVIPNRLSAKNILVLVVLGGIIPSITGFTMKGISENAVADAIALQTWLAWQTILCGYFGYLIDRHLKKA